MSCGMGARMGVAGKRLRRVGHALWLVLAGCRVAPTSAIAPPLSDEDGAAEQDTSAAGAISKPGMDREASAPDEPEAGPTAIDPRPDAGGAMGCLAVDACVAPSNCATEEYGGHTYFVCGDSLTWDDARARCMSAGTDLAILDDKAENDFVASKLSMPSWIGLNDRDTEGDYRWIPPGSASSFGSSASFTNWAMSVPDNCGAGLFGQQDCVRMASDGTWNDSDCAGGCTEGTFAFVCESL